MPLTPPSSKASEIITYAKGRTRQGSKSPSAALGDTQLYIALNDINEWFCYWVFDPDNGGLSPFFFLRDEQLIVSKAATTLNGAIDKAATSIALTSGSDFDSDASASEPGGMWIKDSDGHFDYITYEALTTNDITVASRVDIAHLDDEKCQKIYRLNANFGRPRVLKLSRTKNLIWIDSEFEDIPPPGFFHTKHLISSSGTHQMYIVLPEFTDERTYKLYYVKKPATITGADDRVDAPDGLGRRAVVYMLMAYIWETRGESDKAIEFEKKAIRDMRTFASSQSSIDSSLVQGPLTDYGEI